MEILIGLFTQYLVGWLHNCNSDADVPVTPKEAVRANCDESVDASTGVVTRTFDDDFVRAARIRAKRAVRRAHREDRGQPKRRSPGELDAMAVARFNEILDKPDEDVQAVLGATAPLYD